MHRWGDSEDGNYTFPLWTRPTPVDKTLSVAPFFAYERSLSTMYKHQPWEKIVFEAACEAKLGS